LTYLLQIVVLLINCVVINYINYGDRDEDWEDNDGALNTLSMTHPRIPVEHPSCFVVNDSNCHPLQPGIWYVHFYSKD
jgi:hypothetical protein